MNVPKLRISNKYWFLCYWVPSTHAISQPSRINKYRFSKQSKATTRWLSERQERNSFVGLVTQSYIPVGVVWAAPWEELTLGGLSLGWISEGSFRELLLGTLRAGFGIGSSLSLLPRSWRSPTISNECSWILTPLEFRSSCCKRAPDNSLPKYTDSECSTNSSKSPCPLGYLTFNSSVYRFPSIKEEQITRVLHAPLRTRGGGYLGSFGQCRAQVSIGPP